MSPLAIVALILASASAVQLATVRNDITIKGTNVNCVAKCQRNAKPCTPGAPGGCPSGCNGFACVNGQCVAAGCPGSSSDPEMKGLDGRKFYFDGEAGKVFNLISEENHQVNALFVEGPHRIALHGDPNGHNGTYMGAFGVKFYNTTVEINVDEEGQLSAVYNGVSIVAQAENNYMETFTADLVNVTYDEYRPTMGQAVEIKSDLYRLIIYSTKRQWNAAEQQVTRGHLNMVMIANVDQYLTKDVHGVLGQISPDTADDKSMTQPELQNAFLGEGEDMDYVVSSLLGDDFKYNRYGQPSKLLFAGTMDSKKEVELTAFRRRLAGVSSQNVKMPSGWVTLAEI